MLAGCWLAANHQGDLHVDAVRRDVALFNRYFLFFDPCAAHIRDVIACVGNTNFDGILETGFTGCADLDNFGDAHGGLLDGVNGMGRKQAWHWAFASLPCMSTFLLLSSWGHCSVRQRTKVRRQR